ncbi:MAG: HEAT repeat domain-containing protein [Desulfomonile sp.]|nr:HEAT repeat domain-containing protein [Desulfomonile sp.]
METLKDPEWKVRKAVADALGHFDEHRDKVVEPLIGMLSDENPEVRTVTVLALGKLGKDMSKVQEAITPLSNDPDVQVRIAVKVANALLKPEDASQIPALLEGVAAKDEITSQTAARALRTVGKKAAEQTVSGLTEIIEKGEEPSTKNAIRALGFMPAHAMPALPKILALYDRGDKERRLEVLKASYIIDRNGDMAIPVLVKALSDEDTAVRKQALTGLMRYPDKAETFVGPVAKALADPNEDNRLYALSIVRRVGPKAVEAQPAVAAMSKEGPYKVRLAAISALGSFKPTPEILKALSYTLLDSEPRIREASVGALRRIGQTNTNEVKAILEAAQLMEKDQNVKSVIEQALVGLSRAKPASPGEPKK